MDNLTHSLFALTLARTPLGRAGRGTTLTLLLSSNAPDSDIVAAVASGGQAYLSTHRGNSHGLLGIVALALVVAAAVYSVTRKRGRPPAPFSHLVGIAVIGTLGHVLMDLPTSYGTRLFSPFDRTWYALDLLPIIDVYLLGLLATGLIAARVMPTRRTGIALGVVLLMVLNYAVRARLHATALGRVHSGSALLNSWPDAPAPKFPSDHPCPANPCTLGVAAMPTFGSPFTWRIVRQLSTGYEVRELDLLRGANRPLAWLAHDPDPAVDAARQASVSRSFLAFSRFPVARVEIRAHETTVRMRDVRFLDVPVSGRSEEFRPGGLFSVLVRLDPHGRILEDRFGN